MYDVTREEKAVNDKNNGGVSNLSVCYHDFLSNQVSDVGGK